MKNKKGFVLLETLVVTIFCLYIFTILYASIVPLLGRYKELAYFNDVDTTYDLYHIKKLIVNDEKYSEVISNSYKFLTCTDENISIANQANCLKIFTFLGIDTNYDNNNIRDEVIYLNTSYKNSLLNDSRLSVDVKNYLDYVDISGRVLILQNDGYVSYINL